MGIVAVILQSCTKDADDPTLVKDSEGNTYKVVIIGNQTWMAENLRTTRYNNGDPIPTTTLALDYQDTDKKYQWVYDNNEINAERFGRLYTWYAITDSRGVCPVGWHIPSLEELDVLVEYLGGAEVAGGKLKTAGFSDWRYPNDGATNESGFNLLPAGGRYPDGHFGAVCIMGGFWVATEDDPTNAWGLWMEYGWGEASRHKTGKLGGYSVRCIKDD